MLTITAKPKKINLFSVDMEVSGEPDNFINQTNSYQVATNSGKGAVVHNTVSLLVGVSPGVHPPLFRYYIRRVRVPAGSSYLDDLKKAGHKVEKCVINPETTAIVEFPIALDENVRVQNQVSMWEQLELSAFLQAYWSNNQVSVTVTFSKKEGDEIAQALDFYQYRLKSVSFLPRSDPSEEKKYPQMPYEEITKEEFEQMSKKIKPLVIQNNSKSKEEEQEIDMFCDSETCTVGGKSK